MDRSDYPNRTFGVTLKMSVSIKRKQSTKKKSLLKGLRSFRYGSDVFSFERLERKSLKPRILIKVHPDCRIVVHAPTDSEEEEVLRAVKKRSRWIHKQVKEFRSQRENITPRKYVSGESHYYLGKQHMLKVIEDSESNPEVKLFRGRFEVTVDQRSPTMIRELMDRWYKTRAKDVYERRLNEVLKQALWVSKRPEIRIRHMKTQWGNCSAKGNLTLNPDLVKAPRECIDYVILHELCHIAEHNHSKRFYRLMKQVMPNWEETKERLDGMANVVINRF